MRQTFRDVAMDTMLEEVDHLKIRLSIAEDPDLESRETPGDLRRAIATLEARIAERRSAIRTW